MTSQPDPTPLPQQERLEEIIALYLEAVDAGRAPDRGDWLARHPDLAGSLEMFFADQRRMERFAEPLLSPPAPDGRPEFDDYEVLEEIGRGGMGVVYRARQKSLPRLVALKMIRARTGAGPEGRARFLEEARALARLEHPNIVRIYAVGEQDGRPFFSQELLEESLARRLGGTPLPVREAAELLEVLALAADHAHRHGIIHCDLKPGNVLLQQDGTPRIADFGLARQLESEAGLTRDGEFVGTPSYMAPEQAGHQPDAPARAIGPLTDVYALGAILYECLTGRPPFQGETRRDTLEHVLTLAPVAPRLLNPRVDDALEAICLKCLRKRPKERYGSAAELAAALRAYLDRPDEARGWSSIGNLMFLLAVVVPGGDLAAFLVARAGGPEPLLWLSVFGPYVPLFAVFRANRASRLPGRQPRRLLWSIWVGHLLAYLAVTVACRVTAGPDYARAFLLAYQDNAALTGLAFFVMGSTYWTRYYAFGLAWFALAALMPLEPAYGPLGAAVLHAVCIVLIGLHLRRLEAAGSVLPPPLRAPGQDRP
jgi:serine/threonine-protein kinase